MPLLSTLSARRLNLDPRGRPVGPDEAGPWWSDEGRADPQVDAAHVR
jgi:hypothetical protein